MCLTPIASICPGKFHTALSVEYDARFRIPSLSEQLMSEKQRSWKVSGEMHTPVTSASSLIAGKPLSNLPNLTRHQDSVTITIIFMCKYIVLNLFTIVSFLSRPR